MKQNENKLQIGDVTFRSRLFTGTGKFSSNQVMEESLLASKSELVTVALKRVELGGIRQEQDGLLKHLNHPNIRLLPNTSGVRTAEEAVFAAKMAKEALGTSWVKLEIHPDPRYLLPDPVETLKAAEILVKEDFTVLPYIHADPVLCKRLEDVGTAAVMPLAAPIGSNKGLEMREMLQIIIAESRVPVVIDAGIGAPSHAAEAMEMGADAVLVNTAIAVAGDPVAMGEAFCKAVEAGRSAYESGLGQRGGYGLATSPTENFSIDDTLTGFLD
jgi:thiazole synthase